MSTALYRRYRPETFAEVIGQDHVTGPLRQALRSGRVNHAYLFSGPRGCGKTTSARILARTLNCARNTEETPIDTPCGECSSCIELARGGSGSLDVIEIDAASHNGVDDARELRERATFAPARDRYKIFILDEAHMVTPQGFNALLKLVEEPPPHVKFIFATTEPDKVIGTIRSRTHHYPFRLVPPDVLGPYLEQLCAAEGVTIGTGVVPLVVRSGGGSVRDSLSVMDQLIAGAEAGNVDYERAVDLLGFTHASLLDDVVEALAARDGASIFRVVEQIITTGHEPRRFVEDLLERLRDLIVISVSGGAADAVLRDVPSDQLERMKSQAQNLGAAELSRAADLVNAALTEMSGATSPRLHLELLCARLLLPGVDDGAAGLAARIDRLERGGLGTGGPTPAAPRPGGPESPVTAAPRTPRVEDGAPVAPVNGLSGAAAARAALQARKTGEGVAAAAAPSAPAAPVRPVPVAVPDAVPVDATPVDVAPDATPVVEEAVSGQPVDDASPAPPASSGEPDARATDEWPVVVPVGGAAASPATPEAGPETAPEREHSPVVSHVPDHGTTPTVEPAHAEPAHAEPVHAAQVEPAAQQPAAPAAAVVPATPAAPAGAQATSSDTAALILRWPEVLETLSTIKRLTWMLVRDNAEVAELTESTLVLSFSNGGAAGSFRNGNNSAALQEAVHKTLGFQVRVDVQIDEGDGSPRARTTAGPAPVPSSQPSSGATPPASPSDAPATTRTTPTPPQDDQASGGSAAPTGLTPGAGPVASAPAAPHGAGAQQLSGETATAPDQRGGVALQERPAPVSPPPAPAAPAAPVVEPPVVNAADEAWLAGLPVTEPPADLDEGHEPPPADVRRAAPSGSGPTQRPVAPSAPSAPSAPTPAVPTGPAPGVRETRRQTLERQAAEQKARQSSARVAVSMDDDSPSDDDPDLASSGLVGAPLVAQLLGGVVIDETIDTGL
ncbi:DNA polymerase III subunit gamma and tau [Oerskovia sp. NPDC057915]|uniref:DNA polymerase III subunit gamma and tau n=1 Tax=Oerskovia sp. NPDC057915 TaxID=3346280 RepID=UPI0036DC9B50